MCTLYGLVSINTRYFSFKKKKKLSRRIKSSFKNSFHVDRVRSLLMKPIFWYGKTFDI